METPVLYFSLMLARVAAFVAVLPIYGGRATPRLVRAALSLVLTVFWLGALKPPDNLGLLNQPGLQGWLVLGLALGREAIIGALFGFAFALLLAPARIAGEFASGQIGLAQANLINPTGDASAGPLTIILETLAGLIFLELDLHHLVFGVLHTSFSHLPLGGSELPQPLGLMVQGVATVEEQGVLLGGPLVLALFLVTVILALMARIAPQLNIYSVGFTLQVTAAIIVSFFLMPDLIRQLVVSMGRVGELVRKLV